MVNTPIPGFSIGNSAVKGDYFNFMGVFYENLKFDKYTNHVSSKISIKVGLLNKLKYDLPIDVMHRSYVYIYSVAK